MPNLIGLAIPAFVVLMAVEAVADAIMRRDLYEIKDWAASVSMGLGSVAIGLVTKAMQLGIFSLIYRFRIFNLSSQWWMWLLLFFGDEISYYCFHRASHECRLFWASHVVHHSSQRYNLSTALRQSWTGSWRSDLPEIPSHAAFSPDLAVAFNFLLTGVACCPELISGD